MALLILELALRVYHGELLDFSSELPEVPDRTRRPRAMYDSLLGWAPAVGTPDPRSRATVTPEGLRSNGPGTHTSGMRVLTAGDSFTFGDEVADSETWPAQLGREIGARVFNAGVFAFGIDQAVLRATALLDSYRPDWVVLAFIRDDVRRAELSFYSAWKPYFAIESGELELHNVPVPRFVRPTPRLDGLRRVLGYSLLASAISRRIAAEWWYYGAIVEAHTDGVEVAIRLVTRLDESVRGRGARLLVVGLATGGRIGSNEGMTAILRRMADQGIPTLDLVAGIEAMIASGEPDLYMPGGHYAPRLNHWIATQVGDYLRSIPASDHGLHSGKRSEAEWVVRRTGSEPSTRIE
jgi:hypothetical protein